MREILFRGKRTDNNEWVDGCFYQESDCESYIIPSQTLWYVESDGDDFRAVYTAHRVNIDTIGQYTGIEDKNGTKIFEGDIFMIHEGRDDYKKTHLIWNEDRGMFQPSNKLLRHVVRSFNFLHYEIIGNIHDNPELIK